MLQAHNWICQYCGNHIELVPSLQGIIVPVCQCRLKEIARLTARVAELEEENANLRNPPLTWDDLANLYDEEHPGTSRPARTLPMEFIFQWAYQQKKRFYVGKDNCLHKMQEE